MMTDTNAQRQLPDAPRSAGSIPNLATPDKNCVCVRACVCTRVVSVVEKAPVNKRV